MAVCGPSFPTLSHLAQVAALDMSEAALDVAVLDLWRVYGWTLRVPRKKALLGADEQLLDPYHTHDARRSPAGFPDRVAIRPPRLMFVELKDERGRIRPEQQAWHNALKLCGDQVAYAADRAARWVSLEGTREDRGFAPPTLEAYIWRPSDLLSNTIEAVLR